MVQDLLLGRVRLIVMHNGNREDRGRLEVRIEGGQAIAMLRRTEVLRGDVLEVVHVRRREWELRMADGAVWATQDCGCG